MKEVTYYYWAYGVIKYILLMGTIAFITSQNLTTPKFICMMVLCFLLAFVEYIQKKIGYNEAK
jgi:hypothetical protein